MAEERKYKVRTLKPVTIVDRTAGDTRENVPEGETVTVRVDIARDWIQCGVAEPMEKIPEPAKQPV